MSTMPGFSVFNQNSKSNIPIQPPKSITHDEYEQWKNQYTFAALKNSVRYGQDFCNYFDITDFVLYYTIPYDRADDYIKKHYVK